MRITGGALRGRNIESRDERSLRPTSSKVREAIFNLLKHGRFLNDPAFLHDDNPSAVEDRRVVDIFCGTGALGLEALSRGASFVTFIDQDTSTLAVARKNARQIGVEDRVATRRSDSTRLPRADAPCMLAFIDPPYHTGLGGDALQSLHEQHWLAEGAVVVVEQSKKESLPELPYFRHADERIYKITKITLLQYQPEAA